MGLLKSWQIFNPLSLYCFLLWLNVHLITLRSKRDVVFPVGAKSDECDAAATKNGGVIKGICKKLSECPEALERWNREDKPPRTCFFNKFEQFVCCENSTETNGQMNLRENSSTGSTTNPKRRSEIECEQHYYFRIEVVSGEPTQPKEYPYMAALGWRSKFGIDSYNYRCGGVLISNKFILTAAHCSNVGGDEPSVVRVGGDNLTDTSINETAIKRIYVYPSYDPESAEHDMALIELQREVSEKPACVWSENDIEEINVTAIGYGHTKFAGTSSDQLLKVSLMLVPNDICAQYYTSDIDLLRRDIKRSQICAGDPEQLRDTCQGDSGGPIIMNVNRDQIYSYAVGITSYGHGCAGEPPSVYTRTSSYIDWIDSIVWPRQ